MLVYKQFQKSPPTQIALLSSTPIVALAPQISPTPKCHSLSHSDTEPAERVAGVAIDVLICPRVFTIIRKNSLTNGFVSQKRPFGIPIALHRCQAVTSTSVLGIPLPPHSPHFAQTAPPAVAIANSLFMANWIGYISVSTLLAT
jgi:hypothetical protein